MLYYNLILGQIRVLLAIYYRMLILELNLGPNPLVSLVSVATPFHTLFPHFGPNCGIKLWNQSVELSVAFGNHQVQGGF